MHFSPIGYIRTPYTELTEMPIQPKGANEVEGSIEILEKYAAGLQDLDGFSHVYLIYHLHKASRCALSVIPFMDTVERGIFSTRSPLRPNHIGLSIVEITGVQNNIVLLRGVDVLDKTPLLDLKPYIESFDYIEKSRSGWMQRSREEVAQKRSDNRFI